MKAFAKRSSVSLELRTIEVAALLLEEEDVCTPVGRVDCVVPVAVMAVADVLFIMVVCICRHWPSVMRDRLMLPASTSRSPAVWAFRARSEPAKSTIWRVDTSRSWSMCRAEKRRISMVKKAWEREEVEFEDVELTRRLVCPYSKTVRASESVEQ